MNDPISIKIRSREASARARELLRKLDVEANQRLQFKLRASRAFLAMSELITAAEPRMRKMNPYARGRLTQELQSIETRLLELSKRGI